MMKVLIAIDHTGVAEKAFYYYVENFLKPNDELYITYEAQNPVLPSHAFSSKSPFPADEVSKIMHEFNKTRRELENKYISLCKKVKNVKCKISTDIAPCKPGPAIIMKAEHVKANLIVIGSHSFGERKKSGSSSVSDYVLHHSNLPVLLCRPSWTSQQSSPQCLSPNRLSPQQPSSPNRSPSPKKQLSKHL